MSAPCPVCQQPAVFAYMQDGYDLYHCAGEGCGHCFVSPMPSDEALAKLYDTDSSSIANSDGWTLAEDYKANPQAIHEYYRKTRLQWLQEVAGQLLAGKEAHILDVGCSTGMFLRTLKDMGYRHLHGLDISLDAAQFIREKHQIPCDTRMEDIPEERFDLITCYAILEHVKDPITFTRTLSGKLKPGGRLAILVPNYDSYYRKLAGKSWVWLIPPIHVQYFNRASLKRVMEKAGLRVEASSSGYTSGTYLYLVVHHGMKLLGRSLPSTSRNRDGGTMALIEIAEKTLRLLLWPMRALTRNTGHGNELLMLAARA